MIVEDLRKDATEKWVLDFIKLIYNIPTYQSDIENRYDKLLWIIESFSVAYSSKEIQSLLDKQKITYQLLLTDTRYSFEIHK
jgi:hypothetical protein